MTLRPKTYDILVRAVEEGVAYGWRRAHKHTDKPSPDVLHEEVVAAVMNAICEWFHVDEADEVERVEL